MARQAMWLFTGNVAVRAIGFFGSAYAARCLGPVNLGISALIQSLVLPLTVANGGGLDTPLVRHVAAKPSIARSIMLRILGFRIRMVALVFLPIWLAGIMLWAKPGYYFPAAVGTALLLLSAFVNSAVYQGLQKLPIQSIISLAGTGFTTAAYFIFFRPGMSAGSNLVVIATSTALTTIASWWVFNRVVGPGPKVNNSPSTRSLLRESMPYWIQAFVAYFYCSFQIPLIGWLLGERQLGVYRSAMMLTVAPEMLFTSVNALLLPKLVQWRQLGFDRLWQKQKELVFLCSLIGGAVSVALIIVAPIVYHLVLGREFAEGIVPFRILVVARAVIFVGQIFMWSLTALHLDRQSLYASTGGAIFSVAANLVVIPAFGLVGAAMVNLLTEIIVQSTCFLFVTRHMRQHR